MPRFLILDDAVNRQATSLGTTVEDLQQVLRRYHGTARSSFAHWAGLGAGAFQQFDARFQNVSQGLVTSLETLWTEVDAAGTGYDDHETAQQAAVAALRNLEGVPAAPGGGADQPVGDGGDGGGSWDGVGDFFGGLAHPFREMWDSAWKLLTDPGGWLSETWDGIYDSVAFWNWDTFAETWKEAGKDFVAWDEWGENWPRALGITVTNVGLTVLTLGAGALIRRFLLKGGGSPGTGAPDRGPGDRTDGNDRGGGDGDAAAPAHRAQVDEGKLNYAFGRITTGPEHNIARSRQLGDQLARIGLHDTPEGRQHLREHFDQAVRTDDNVAGTYTDRWGDRERRESLLAGPSGVIKLRTTWEVLPNGDRRLLTIIPFGAGGRYRGGPPS